MKIPSLGLGTWRLAGSKCRKNIAIPKASSEKHLRENHEIFDFNLSGQEMAVIDALNTNQRLIAPEYNEF